MATDKKSELLVVTKSKELCSYIIKVTQKSPKQFRFTFVSRLQNLALDVIENIYLANEIFVGKGGERNIGKRLLLQHRALTILRLIAYISELAMTEKCILFKQYEPKARSIFAPDYADRVVQHCLCDNIVMPKLDPKLIYDNAACRVGKGTHFSINRLSGFMREFYRCYGTKGFFLKCDIRKYFDNINHNVLKQKLQKVFEPDVFDLLCLIIDSYEIAAGNGVPLGNQTSQWFALYYLDTVDRLVKEKLRIKYYVRYMDDFVLLCHDKEYLRHCLNEIRRVCGNELKIELNSKSQIFPMKNGVDYLGWHFYLTETGKVIRKLRVSKKGRLKRRLKLLQREYEKGLIDLEAVKRSMVSTRGHLIHGHTYRLRNKLSMRTVFRRKESG